MNRECESDSNSSAICPLELAREQHVFETFVYVNGRRFQVGDDQTRPFLPDDKEEAIRRCAKHYVHKHIWKGSYSAPVEEELMFGSAKVLDLRCGTGIWTLDMAAEFPLSTFVGVDYAPVFPDSVMKPPNVGFLQCNVLDGVPFPENTFHLVKQRDFMTTISANWATAVLPEMVRVTVPGGWIEVEEFDFLESVNIGPTGQEFFDAMIAYFNRMEIERVPHGRIKQCMENLGLEETQSKLKKIKIGTWGGKVGELVLDITVKAFIALNAILPSVMNISEQEYELKIQQYSQEVNEYKSELLSYRVLARKPLVAETGRTYKLFDYGE